MKTLLHHALLLSCTLCLTGALAFAQGPRPGGGPPGGGMGGGGMGLPGGSSNGRMGNPIGGSRSNGPSGMGGGPQSALSGRWWDDKGVAKTLGLSRDQQKKMDAVFNANRNQLVESYGALQKEEAHLESLNKEKKPDEAKIFASIDAVAQARASLAKVNAHMLLQVRQELDAEQNSRMEKLREQSGQD